MERPRLRLSATVLHAPDPGGLEVGATLADHHPQDDVRVLLDPVGHPFCRFAGTD